MIGLFLVASACALAGLTFWCLAMIEMLEEVPEPETTSRFVEGERVRVPASRPTLGRTRPSPPIDKWYLVALGMKAKLK